MITILTMGESFLRTDYSNAVATGELKTLVELPLTYELDIVRHITKY